MLINQDLDDLVEALDILEAKKDELGLGSSGFAPKKNGLPVYIFPMLLSARSS